MIVPGEGYYLAFDGGTRIMRNKRNHDVSGDHLFAFDGGTLIKYIA
jgi:hypothetical protein